MRVFKFVFQTIKPYQNQLITARFFITFIMVLSNSLKPFLLKKIIDIVTGKFVGNLWLICAIYALLEFSAVAVGMLSDYCTRYVAMYRLNIIEFFIKKLNNYSFGFFQNQLSGSLTSKIGDVFQYTPSLILTFINSFIHFLLLIIISLGFLASVSPIFVIIVAIWGILFVMVNFFSRNKTIFLSKNYSEEKAKIIGAVADYLTNIITVKIFARNKFEVTRFDGLKPNFINSSNRQLSYIMWFYGIQGFFTCIYTIGFISLLIIGFQKNMIGPGDFVLVIMTNLNIINGFTNISESFREFFINLGSVDQALLLLDHEPNLKEEEKNVEDLIATQGEIIFDRIKFSHKGDNLLFDNESIIIKAGQKIGLVGHSGGGKSSFVNLILRLHKVSQGSIFIDGQDISKVNEESLRQNISFIPQDPFLFHRSLMDNIRYGKIEASDDEVIEASKKAHAHEFITDLPGSYGTFVGERGVKLSGGQRQRIAIARAVLKNAPILILDEATSQLDSLTESFIQESLANLMEKKTSIVIAHRLSTLLNMDRILVFDKGKIVEDGSPKELLSMNGLYKKLWDAQVGGFINENND